MAQFSLKRLSHALGAEIRGLDLRQPLDSNTVAELRDAWLKYLLLYFPEQDIDAGQLARFARYFGEHESLPLRNTVPEVPQVEILTNQTVNNVEWDGYKNGKNWHSDRSYTTCPTAAIVLLSKIIPEVGGDTMFANMYMAYDTLSPKLKGIVDDLWAVHDRDLPLAFGGGLVSEEVQQMIQKASSKFAAGEIPIAQPIARVHAETGKRSLYLGKRVREIVGMTQEESRVLSSYLDQHATIYEFHYRHRWRVNDVLFWDNRCTMHNALMDYDIINEPRTLLKCALTIPGKSETGYPYTKEQATGAPPVAVGASPVGAR